MVYKIDINISNIQNIVEQSMIRSVGFCMYELVAFLKIYSYYYNPESSVFGSSIAIRTADQNRQLDDNSFMSLTVFSRINHIIAKIK